MSITKQQIADSLINEHKLYIEEVGVEKGEMCLSDYIDYINTLSYQSLVFETSTDDDYTLDEFIHDNHPN